MVMAPGRFEQLITAHASPADPALAACDTRRQPKLPSKTDSQENRQPTKKELSHRRSKKCDQPPLAC
jgi:hypothetical protein